ncbi:MAG: NAD(P)-dependent oxidoreductase [Actinobacteria bacterium]|nr:NAD(P)-dependent oxidoreductase [Actinomycetota bacterium]
MRVFVAGATGAIGRPLVRQLVEVGHEVTGTTRSEARAEEIRAAGATPAVCDALDAGALRAAVEAAQPDVVVHELTDLPAEWSMRTSYGSTGRLRSEGGRNLVEAAKAAGARRVVAQSIAFVYEPAGGPVKDEEAPTMTPGSGAFAEALERTFELERVVTGTNGIEGIVLRYGFFYGPGTWYAPGTKLTEQVRRRRVPIVGEGGGLFSFIHVDDAASATVAALDHGAPGIYNIVDDDPASMRDWVSLYAEAIGAPPPRRVPLWLAKLLSSTNAGMATALRGASNAKARRELGWEPRHPSWRDGFRAVLAPG